MKCAVPGLLILPIALLKLCCWRVHDQTKPSVLCQIWQIVKLLWQTQTFSKLIPQVSAARAAHNMSITRYMDGVCCCSLQALIISSWHGVRSTARMFWNSMHRVGCHGKWVVMESLQENTLCNSNFSYCGSEWLPLLNSLWNIYVGHFTNMKDLLWKSILKPLYYPLYSRG